MNMKEINPTTVNFANSKSGSIFTFYTVIYDGHMVLVVEDSYGEMMGHPDIKRVISNLSNTLDEIRDRLHDDAIQFDLLCYPIVVLDISHKFDVAVFKNGYSWTDGLYHFPELSGFEIQDLDDALEMAVKVFNENDDGYLHVG